jgi:hypothetical protein
VRDRFTLRNTNIQRLLQANVDVAEELLKHSALKYEEQRVPEGLRRILPPLAEGEMQGQDSGETAGREDRKAEPQRQPDSVNDRPAGLLSDRLPERVPSPLSYSLENSLKAPGVGLELIMGSFALGMDRVQRALETLFSEAGSDLKNGAETQGPPRARVERVPELSDPQAQADFIRESYEKSDGGTLWPQILLLPSGGPARFWKAFGLAQDFLDDRRGDKGLFRVIGIADADTCLAGASDPAFLKDGHTEHFLERWNKNSLANYLEATGTAVDRTTELLDGTGGWDCLLLFRLKLMRERSRDPQPWPLPEDFRKLAGFSDPPPLYRLIDDFLCEYSSLPFTSEDFVDLLRDHHKDLVAGVKEGDPASPYAELEFTAREALQAFNLVQRLTLVIPDRDTGPGGDGPKALRFKTDPVSLECIQAKKEGRWLK